MTVATRRLTTVMPSDFDYSAVQGQYARFLSVHTGQGHICPRCGVQVAPDVRGMCGPCEAELRRITRLTARGGDAYENESE